MSADGMGSVELVLFDLDHTLLSGDSDVLWCEFLMSRGVLDRASFGARNAEMESGYRAGTVSVADFSGFYVSTLAGRAAADWQPFREAFLSECVAPRIPAQAHALVRRHQAQGANVVLTTATNRFITELTAAHLGIDHLIATECELDPRGRFTGRPAGVLNMREGKVVRLRDWLAGRGMDADPVLSAATFYSDSRNDLPLLRAVGQPVAVDPDDQLLAEARAAGWPVLRLER